MVAELLVERVELLARGGAHYAGDAEVIALPAGPHLDGAGVEVGRVPVDDVDDSLRESGALASHHLDREIAGKSEERSALCLRDAQADTGSRLPARMTFC